MCNKISVVIDSNAFEERQDTADRCMHIFVKDLLSITENLLGQLLQLFGIKVAVVDLEQFFNQLSQTCSAAKRL